MNTGETTGWTPPVRVGDRRGGPQSREDRDREYRETAGWTPPVRVGDRRGGPQTREDRDREYRGR